MAVQNVLPTLAAEEKSAHLNLRAVHIPNGLADTGRLLSDAGNGLQKAAAGLMLGLKRQRDEMNAREDALALAQAKVNYSRDTTKGMTELLKRSGAEAKGITNEYETMSRNARDRWTETLSPRAAREFQIWTDQQNLAGWQKVQGHEYSSVRGAQVDMGKQTISSSVQSFSITGSVFDLDAALQAHDDVYELVNGNVGEAYDILKRDDESAPEAKLTAEERSGVETRVKVYEKSRQNVIDQALGARMQYLLEQGDIYGASVFFNSFGKNGIAPSKEAETVMRGVLEKEYRGLQINALAGEKNTVIRAAGGDYSLGGRYATPEAEQAFAEEYARLLRSGTEDDLKVAKALSALHSADVAVQRANLAADKAANLRGLTNWKDPFQGKQNLLQFQSVLNKLGPSVLRDELQEEFDKYEAAFNREEKAREAELKAEIREQKAELREQRAEERQIRAEWKEWMKEFKDDAERKGYVGMLKLRLGQSEPIVRYGEATYDTRDDERFEAMLFDLNWRNNGFLTDDDVEALRMQRRLGTSAERIDASDRVARILNELNDTDGWTGPLAAAAAPKLVDDVMDVVYRYTSGGKDKGKAFDDAINQVIYTKLAEERVDIVRMGMQSVTLSKWLGKGLDANGNLDPDYNQKRFSWKYKKSDQILKQTMREAGISFNAQGGHSDYALESQAAIAEFNKTKPDEASILAHEQDMAKREKVEEGYAIAHQAIEEGLDEASFRRQLIDKYINDRTHTPKPMTPKKAKEAWARVDEVLQYYRELKKKREEGM